MAYNYAPLVETASRLLADFGQTAYIRSRTVTASNPVAGTVTRSAATDTAVNCVRVRFTERNTPAGALIQQGDWLALLDGDIELDDELVLGSDVWRVVDVFPVEPGSTGLLWKAQIRK